MSRNLPLKKIDKDCVNLMCGLLDSEEKTGESELESINFMKKIIIKSIKDNYKSYKESKDKKSKEKYLSILLKTLSNKVFWDVFKYDKYHISLSIGKYIDLDKEERYSLVILDHLSTTGRWSYFEACLDGGLFDYSAKRLNNMLGSNTITTKSIQTAYDPEGEITPRTAEPRSSTIESRIWPF